MLYLYCGTDQGKIRKNFNKTLSFLLAKRKDSIAVHMDSLNWDERKFEEGLLGQGLFSKKYIITLSNVFENKSAQEYIFDRLKDVKDSENIFIFILNEVDTKIIKKLEKYSDKTEEHKKLEKEEDKFNIFSVTDAFGKRDKKNFWTLANKAMLSGVAPEEVFWKLNWQLKTMSLVYKTKNEKESGLKSFVYKKTVGFNQNYKEEEVRDLRLSLQELYHESRLGRKDFDIGLEQFILSI